MNWSDNLPMTNINCFCFCSVTIQIIYYFFIKLTNIFYSFFEWLSVLHSVNQHRSFWTERFYKAIKVWWNVQ